MDACWRARPSRTALLIAALAALLIASACTAPGLPSPPPASPPPPLPETPAADWAYALRVLALGDLTTARPYLERAVQMGVAAQAPDPQQVYRDLAETRLLSGDAAGAAAAVDLGRTALGQQRLNARFTSSERRLFERTLDALQAAATDDISGLRTLATSDESPPLADAWYLLGWAEERRADVSAARAAYQGYLDRAPTWSYLRATRLMRDHARAVVSGST